MSSRTTVALIAMLVAFAACGDSDVAQTTTTAQPDGQVETVLTATPAETDGSLEVELITGLVYHPQDDRFTADSGLIDVVAPTDGGPWPTVVVFHGDPRFTTKTWHRPDATMLAEHGRVVFLPAWGHTTTAIERSDVGEVWSLLVRELTCAVRWAHDHTSDYGGDPDHITLYGLSAGGNAVMMAGLSDSDPIETCAASGPAVAPQALVPIDADWVLGGAWDSELSENPGAFYAFTPWRYLDGTHDVRIHVMVTENPGPSYTRTVGSDPSNSWLSYRHPDIDLLADLEARGFLSDDALGVRESGEYAFQLIAEAGYDATLTVVSGASHTMWGAVGTQVIVDTVLDAE